MLSQLEPRDLQVHVDGCIADGRKATGIHCARVCLCNRRECAFQNSGGDDDVSGFFFFPDDLIERRWTRQMASTRPKRGVLSEHFRLFGIVNFNYTSTLFRLWTCCVIKFTGKKRKYFDWLIFLYCASFAY